ncbi:MAG: hypothetical protein ACI8YI_000785 [Paracoccaceae bacterium]|jgi:hypothetical protein
MFTLRQMLANIFRPIPLISWVLATVLTSISGPFQTLSALDQPYLTFYWAVIAGGSIALGVTTVNGIKDGFLTNNLPLRALLIALVFSTLNCGFILVVNQIALPNSFTSGPPIWMLFVTSAVIVLFVVFVISYLAKPAELNNEILFYKRLKPNLGKNLIRLCGQDHYVEVCTDAGKDMILMRFSDAMNELAGYKGLQVHRSHWVALAAIDRVEKSGTSLKVLMKDGSQVPVSRSFRTAIKDAGLL